VQYLVDLHCEGSTMNVGSATSWPGDAYDASEFLDDQGYTLTVPDFMWRKPTPEHAPTERERAAVRCLIEEWDMDGIVEEIPGVCDWRNRRD
jgi:hypothetical protein